MSDLNDSVLPCILYEEKVKHSDYDMVKIEFEMEDDSLRRRTLPRFSGDKGVEGLFYVYDEFMSQAANRLPFEGPDYWKYWPDVLDPVARRKWTQRNGQRPVEELTKAHFEREFSTFVTLYANNARPRDDLIKYLWSDECKKPRKVSPDDHATRMETLCLYANRMAGFEAALTEDQVKLIIFNSFPEPWKRDFKIGRGRPENFNLFTIMEYMNLRKTFADSDEGKHKKRKNDKNDQSESNKKKQAGKQNDRNMCRHHGTHPWHECSLNPQSKNYHLNPQSPFYRGGRGRGRIQDGGRGGRGRGGRGHDFGGRGGMHPPAQQQYYNQGGSRGEHYNDRGSDRSHDRGSSGYSTNTYSTNQSYFHGDAERQYDNNNHGRGNQW